MGKNNDVPKDITEMIIESVNSCGKVEDWRFDDRLYRKFVYEIKTNDVDFVATKRTYFRGPLLPERKEYHLNIKDVEYEGDNAHRIFDVL